MSSLCAVWLTISLAAGQVEPAALEAEPELDAKLLARWGEVYLKEAQQYEMFLGEGREMPLELQPKPVFRWAEPLARNKFNGVIYVWTYQGRPEVIGSIWAKGELDRPGKLHALPHVSFAGHGAAGGDPQCSWRRAARWRFVLDADQSRSQSAALPGCPGSREDARPAVRANALAVPRVDRHANQGRS